MRIWLLSETFFPDEAGTAYYMTKLAEHFAASHTVNVITGMPKYDARGTHITRTELLNGIMITRCQDSTLDKNIFLFRVVNVLISSMSILAKAAQRIRKNAIVIVVTSPPMLPFVIEILCRIRRAKFILKVDDVYPEVLVATGFLKKGSFVESALSALNLFLYKRADRIIVLGRDMAKLAQQKIGNHSQRIDIITNWSDSEIIHPRPRDGNPLLNELGLTKKFVVQCAGNMGRAQAIETIFSAADQLLGQENIHFLFIGSGQKTGWMENRKKVGKLTNITLLRQRSRHEQEVFLNACDISVATLLPGMTGAGVPSRIYNVMAAGKPLISVASVDSEISLVVEEEKIGWVVSPSDPELLAKIILEASHDPLELERMGQRARQLAETRFSRQTILGRYDVFLEEMNRMISDNAHDNI